MQASAAEFSGYAGKFHCFMERRINLSIHLVQNRLLLTSDSCFRTSYPENLTAKTLGRFSRYSCRIPSGETLTFGIESTQREPTGAAQFTAFRITVCISG